MVNKQLGSKILSATKWSTITQIISKLITPLTNMILARILVPEAFGVIATITMIVSFTEMFTEAGFQKYLVQRQFKNIQERFNNANVAFWTNFILSIFIWLIIIIFNNQIALLVGNPGMGIVIIVACIQLPLTSFSSIQMSLYRRDFDFKTLFYVRVIGSLIPLIITIPLALIGFDYWSLIIGMLSMQLFNAVFLTLKSQWKPSLFYEFKILKEMLSFSAWSFLEQTSIWLSVWIDTFVISYYLNQYYLGIYKTSTIMVNSLLTLITAAIIPVLFSALSRLQDDNINFNKLFFKFQRLVAMFVLPLGVGVFLYSDLATAVMLGNQWTEASEVIGIWALTRCILMVFGYFASEAYRAKGKPKLSFYAQLLHLIVLVPACIIAVNYGFWELVYVRALIVLQLILVHFILMKIYINVSILQTIKNVIPSITSVLVMWIFGYFIITLNNSMIWMICSIVLCMIIYFTVLFSFSKPRKEFRDLIKKVI